MSEQRRRGPMGGHGRMMSGEKAKDFKGSMAKLFRYMGRYKFRNMGNYAISFRCRLCLYISLAL